MQTTDRCQDVYLSHCKSCRHIQSSATSMAAGGAVIPKAINSIQYVPGKKAQASIGRHSWSTKLSYPVPGRCDVRRS